MMRQRWLRRRILVLISLTQEQDKRTGPAERSADLEEVQFNVCDEDENGNDSDDLEDVEFYLCNDDLYTVLDYNPCEI